MFKFLKAVLIPFTLLQHPQLILKNLSDKEEGHLMAPLQLRLVQLSNVMPMCSQTCYH